MSGDGITVMACTVYWQGRAACLLAKMPTRAVGMGDASLVESDRWLIVRSLSEAAGEFDRVNVVYINDKLAWR